MFWRKKKTLEERLLSVTNEMFLFLQQAIYKSGSLSYSSIDTVKNLLNNIKHIANEAEKLLVAATPKQMNIGHDIFITNKEVAQAQGRMNFQNSMEADKDRLSQTQGRIDLCSDGYVNGAHGASTSTSEADLRRMDAMMHRSPFAPLPEAPVAQKDFAGVIKENQELRRQNEELRNEDSEKVYKLEQQIEGATEAARGDDYILGELKESDIRYSPLIGLIRKLHLDCMARGNKIREITRKLSVSEEVNKRLDGIVKANGEVIDHLRKENEAANNKAAHLRRLCSRFQSKRAKAAASFGHMLAAANAARDKAIAELAEATKAK